MYQNRIRGLKNMSKYGLLGDNIYGKIFNKGENMTLDTTK